MSLLTSSGVAGASRRSAFASGSVPRRCLHRPMRNAVVPSSQIAGVPVSILTDSYKATHYLQYPKAQEMVAYGEFRQGYNKDDKDTRLVVYGIRYLIENYVAKQWSIQDVQSAALFFKTHLAPSHSEFPFPIPLFEKFVKENNGYFPITIEALPEGTCVNARVPVYQITASGEYAPLCTFLETLLTMIWYPTTVATLSRRSRDVIEHSFEKTSDMGLDSPLIDSRLHDFGFRGCTTVEQSILGGCGHLLSFVGSDTLSACYYSQFMLNNGKPVAQSIPATEHSVMTSWATEQEAMENMIDKFGTGLFAVVMDSYDYSKALMEMLPVVAAKKVEKGGYLVLRPDSGDPTEAVLMALTAADRAFGSAYNKKGYRVVQGCGVIQGDGIDIDIIRKVSGAVEAAGYSAENVAYGMGGGLLQKVHRDTMSFATKLNHIIFADGTKADIMKQPASDSGKFSLPGVLAVQRVNGVPTVFPKDGGEVSAEENMLKVVYDKGPVEGMVWDDFDTVRETVKSQWRALPLTADNLSESLKVKIRAQMKKQGKVPTI